MSSRLIRVWQIVLLGTALFAAGAASAKSIRFVTEPLPPYTYLNGDKVDGPMAQVLMSACARLAWDCELKIMPWRRSLQTLKNGHADGIFMLHENSDRRRNYFMSPNIIVGRYVVFERIGMRFEYKDQGSLAGHTVGAYGPSGTSQTLNEIASRHGVDVQIESDNVTVLRKLVFGRYGNDGLALMNEAVGLYLLKHENLEGLQEAGEVEQFHYGIGLSRRTMTAQLSQQFNKVITEMCVSGEISQILARFEMPASPCNP